MKEIAIVCPVRTPVGGFGGSLKDVSAIQLGALVIKEIIKRTGIDPASIDEVIMGHGYPNGENPDIGRLCALMADLPIEVPGLQVDRRCSSGLMAICTAAMLIQTENAEIVIAGGTDNMSQAEHYLTGIRWDFRRGSPTLYDRLLRSSVQVCCPDRVGPVEGMIGTAENVAVKYNISRQAQDEFALRSHRNACAAIDAGKFKDEIVPVPIPQRRGEPILVTRDEHARPDTSLERLAQLPPVLGPGKTVTAGNASGQNDAAAACLVMSADKAKELGLEIMGYLKAWAAAGVDPLYMGIGPVPATQKVLAKAGLTLDDMDLIEINEAFAAQVLAVIQQWKLPNLDRLNVNGSGISLGHPIGATGARILATLLNEMKRRNARYGLETMCVGGGQGMAAIFERRR